ncbi:MAG: alpha/beta fold hydrolase, partial [Alphaproteobacteria bacterium]
MMIKTRDGVELNVRTDGYGGATPLILSNSLGTDLHLWDSLAAKMATSRKVVRYDKRGHGHSDVPVGPYTNALLSEDVIDIMDALDIERANFCGISMGGMAGQWLAANRPDRFRRVVLASTVPHVDMDEVWNGRIETVNASGMASIEEAVLERWFTPRFRVENPDAVRPIQQMILQTDPAGYTACCAAV